MSDFLIAVEQVRQVLQRFQDYYTRRALYGCTGATRCRMKVPANAVLFPDNVLSRCADF
jgi:hypothetical protein